MKGKNVPRAGGKQENSREPRGRKAPSEARMLRRAIDAAVEKARKELVAEGEHSPSEIDIILGQVRANLEYDALKQYGIDVNADSPTRQQKRAQAREDQKELTRLMKTPEEVMAVLMGCLANVVDVYQSALAALQAQKPHPDVVIKRVDRSAIIESANAPQQQLAPVGIVLPFAAAEQIRQCMLAIRDTEMFPIPEGGDNQTAKLDDEEECDASTSDDSGPDDADGDAHGG